MKVSPKNINYIICPYCKAEYHISEIFYPTDIVSTPKELIKTEDGKIDYIIDDDKCLDTTYYCDYCNKQFKVTADISFKVSRVEPKEFEEESSFKIYPNRVMLDESE